MERNQRLSQAQGGRAEVDGGRKKLKRKAKEERAREEKKQKVDKGR